MKQFIFIAYTLTLCLFTVFSYFFIDPNLIYLKPLYTGFAFENKLFVTVVFVIFLFLLFYFYYKFIQLTKKKEFSWGDIKKIIFVTFIILLFSYPTILSYDIFNYITTAKVTFFYQENPYIVMPIEFAHEPYLEFTRAANKTALYGPLWILITSVPFILGFNNFLLTVLLFKLLVFCFYFGLVYLIWKLSDNLLSVVFFALNPLVILETFVSGHNDVVMMFFALAGLYFLLKEKKMYSMILYVFSIFIKYASVFLIPVFAYISYLKVKGKSFDKEKIYHYSLISMLVIFLLSPLREEMYPWYAIWIIPFAALSENKNVRLLMSAFSFGLMLRYIPYMATGTYIGYTPVVRIILMIIPLIIALIYFLYKNKSWQRLFHF